MKPKRLSRRSFVRFFATAATGAVAAACAPKTVIVEKEVEKVVTQVVKETVKETVVVAGTPQVVEKEVTKVVEKVIMATPVPVEPSTVTYWQYMTNMETIESTILDAFDAANPSITLKYEYIPWSQYWEKLGATLASGDPPDVWNTAPTFFFEYILRNQLADLSDLIAQDIDFSDFYETALSGYDLKGKYYGVPRNIVTENLFFNKDLFAAAGVEPPPLDGNWTWDDFRDKAKALTTEEVWGCQAIQHSSRLDFVIMDHGGEVFKGDFRRDLVGMEANYDSEIGCEVIQFFSDLINVDKVAFPAGEFEGMGNPFMTGKVGMVWSLNWMVLTAKEAPFEWDFTLPPKGREAQFTYGGADGLVISQDTKSIDGSWKLILWLIDPKTGRAFLEDSGAMPVTRTYAGSDRYLGKYPDKNMQSFLDAAEIAINTFTLGYNEWKSTLQQELDKAFLGQAPPEQVCKDANAAANASIERIREDFAEALGQ